MGQEEEEEEEMNPLVLHQVHYLQSHQTKITPTHPHKKILNLNIQQKEMVHLGYHQDSHLLLLKCQIQMTTVEGIISITPMIVPNTGEEVVVVEEVLQNHQYPLLTIIMIQANNPHLGHHLDLQIPQTQDLLVEDNHPSPHHHLGPITSSQKECVGHLEKEVLQVIEGLLVILVTIDEMGTITIVLNEMQLLGSQSWKFVNQNHLTALIEICGDHS